MSRRSWVRTEADWLACDAPTRLGVCVRDDDALLGVHRPDPWRFRFLAVGWGRLIRGQFRLADRDLFDDFTAWVAGSVGAWQVRPEPSDAAADYAATCAKALRAGHPAWAAGAAADARASMAEYERHRHFPDGETGEHVRLRFCAEFRCVAGNPFQPVAFRPEWRTSDAVGLAHAVDVGGRFDVLPILADALEDAGCDALDLLSHLRGGGPHARGCFAVDALLGRTPATPPSRSGY